MCQIVIMISLQQLYLDILTTKMGDHNLQIETYSLEELLGLFHFTIDQNIDVDDLKRAKKTVLMMHPDKSKLPKEYFLFYKKALDMIVRLYDNVQKVSRSVEDTVYKGNDINAVDEEHSKQFRKKLGEIPTEQFHKTFHSLFEKHAKKPVNQEKYAWFSSEEESPVIQSTNTIHNANQINHEMDKIKQRQQEMTVYQDVRSMTHTSGNSFYQDNDDDDDDGSYVECDPFSKLKFDDVRKVHRDQVVIGVRDSDFSQVPKYKNVDEYQRTRHVAGSVAPMEKTQAQHMIDEQERFLQNKIRNKQYHSEQTTMRNIEMNKQVMSNFLYLTN
jgi:hypothetical protein